MAGNPKSRENNDPVLLAAPDSIRLNEIGDLLGRYRFRFTSERELQDGIALVLEQARLRFRRETGLNRHDRPDFLLDDGIGIEVKIKGSQAELLRQASRYLVHQEIKELLIVGTPHWLTRVPTSLLGKSVLAVRLIGSLL